MDVQLFHGDDQSAIVAGSTVIEYGRRIHRYESAGDYALIKTELLTYGQGAAQAVVDHLAAARGRSSHDTAQREPVSARA